MSGAFMPPPSLPREALQANLAAAQAAYHSLMIGRREAIVMYSMGEGTRQVTYTQTSVKALRAYIAELQQQLGYRSRRAIVPSFR